MFLASSTAALAACLEIFNLRRDQSQKRFLNNLAISLCLLLDPSHVPLTQRETTPAWFSYFCVAAGWVGVKIQPAEYWALLKKVSLSVTNMHRFAEAPVSDILLASCSLLKTKVFNWQKTTTKKLCKRNKIVIKQKKAPSPEEQLSSE